jgi:FixJ family two-component response regulator
VPGTRYVGLTGREQEILRHVTEWPAEQADRPLLGVSEITVKIHRGNVMREMGAKSLPELVRMAEALTLSPARPSR